MIIPLNVETENTYYKIFETIKYVFNKLNNFEKKKGRPYKYSDEQILACTIYGVRNSIFSLRELEYKINRDPLFKYTIGIDKSPDYSTLSLRLNKIERFIYYGIYAMLIESINPDTRICAIDGTALRSSKFDGDARKGKGTRLGFYIGYKLHCIASVTDVIIPLIFDITTANVYDNQLFDLMYEAKIYNPFMILADAAYDDENWFKIAKDLDLNLLTDVNIRNSKSIESFSENRYNNALFRESTIGSKLYKNRLKIEQLFSVLKRKSTSLW